jgi:hypothetical protein
MREVERLVSNFSRPGHFRRDQDGNEHEVRGYIVRFSYESRVRGEEGTVTNFETAVVLASSRMDAQSAATRAYNDVNILSIEEAHPGTNRTLFRISQV